MSRTVDLKNRRLAALLAWLVPGLGHYYQGRIGKAILYAVAILGLYTAGMILGDGKVVLWRWLNPLRDPENFKFSYLCQFFVGLPALPALIQETLQYYGLPTLFQGVMSAPPLESVTETDVVRQNVLNGLHTKLGKNLEIGMIYTMMAGLLNILAIYDAYDGPGYAEQDEAEDREKAAATARTEGVTA